jgi:type IV pilus assembly protein PilN
MIKVNLIPSKKKKKQKPLPTFLLYTVLLTILTALVLGYLAYFFSARLSDREATVRDNDRKITELKAKIKAVEDFERLNKTFQQRKDIIEQLGKNKSLPVKILDEISAQLPVGVWLTAMDVKGSDINLGCTAFSNTDVVNYVNNLKNSKLFTEVYLQESIQAKTKETSVYTFRLTFKVKS